MSELKKVGNYKLVKKIGTGSTSQVFEGRKEGELERYAVKMIKNKTISKQQKEMIAKEVLIIKNISHPHIVRLHDTLETPNHYYLIFEFCERGDLEKYLKDNVGALLELTKVRAIIRCIAQAVAHLHSKGIAHRDIKLANILLKRDFTIKLADFGFARQSTSEQALMKTYCGTPITMAPQIMEGKTYDKKCDVWSLGVILFQLAFGKLPFPIDQGQVVFIKKVTTERVEMPTSLKVPNSLADLIFRALERDPVKRCSVEEFLSSQWMSEEKIIQNVPTRPHQSINQILKKANKEQAKSGHCWEEQGKDNECLERLLAARLYDIICDEIASIYSRHVAIRNELLKLVEGEELTDLLYYYDYTLLNKLKLKKIKLRYQGVEDFLFPLNQLRTIQVPQPLVQNPGQTPQAGVVLSNYLRDLAKNPQLQNQKKLRRYLVVTKFMDLIQNFEIEVIFLFNNGYEYELSLNSLGKWLLEQPEKLDPSLFHKGLNHITIALQCRQKEEGFRECANTLKTNCQKRMDAIQRDINSS